MMLELNERNQEIIEKGIRRSNVRPHETEEISKLSFHSSKILKPRTEKP